MKNHTDDKFYKEFDLTSVALLTMIRKSKELTDQDWAKLKAVKAKVVAELEKEAKAKADSGDDQLIEKTRKDQINARINVRKTWLPLQ